MIEAIILIIPKFVNQLLLLFFLAFIFALLGLQMFMGIFRTACFDARTGMMNNSARLYFLHVNYIGWCHFDYNAL